MDFLNRAYSQLHDLFRSMTPGSRWAAALSAVVALSSLGYLLTHQTVTPDADLMHGVPVAASQLPKMEAALAKANLTNYRIDGASIRVPRGQEPVYMGALVDAKALPPNIGEALIAAVSNGNAFESRDARDERLKIARQTEMSLVIRSMPGIENAFVLYDVDMKTGFQREKLITATVSVKPVGDTQLDEARISSIRYFIAGAIAGLKPENVTVSDLNGRTWHGIAEDAGSADENLYISLKRTYEQDLKAKILNALCFIPKVTVEPTVVLDRERLTHFRQEKRTPNDEPRPAGSTRSPRCSVLPNTAAILDSLLSGSTGDAPPTPAASGSHEQIERESVGLTPIQARVSVGVPVSYFKKIWQEQHAVEPGHSVGSPDLAALDRIRAEESEKIRRHVAQLLPSPESPAKAAELVTVTTFQDISTPVEKVAHDYVQDVLAWLQQSWRTLSVLGLALIGLLVLRSIVRQLPRPSIPEPTASESIAMPEGFMRDDATTNAAPSPHAKRFREPAPAYHDEISELVDRDPDAAANVLRHWIGQVD
ncbi:MAG: hypothetical protein ABFC77_00380 [Thermoguttaceae bacterium]